jgi:diacylglycerol kinase family enzyme
MGEPTPVAAPAPRGAPALVAVIRGASRIHDPERREALVRLALAAARGRTGGDAVAVELDHPGALRTTVADAIAAGAPLVVVLGGDGSQREAAAALAATGVPLGIVPAGTANLFAASVGIPGAPEEAVRAIAAGTTRSLDLGLVRPLPGAEWRPAPPSTMLVAMGTGFDARVMAGTGGTAKRRLGTAAYFATGLRQLHRARPFEVALEIDGTRHETAALAVLVANTGQLLPGLLGPRLAVDPADGLLDVLVVRGAGPIGGLRSGLLHLVRGAEDTAVADWGARIRGRSIRRWSDPPQPVEIVGDVVGAGAFEAEVRPSVLRVVLHARKG